MANKNIASTPEKNPKRVEAGRRNQMKWPGLTADGRKRQQASIRVHQPWLQATGPRTADGKKKSAQNGSLTRRGNRGVSAMRRELAAVAELIGHMQEIRQGVFGNHE